MKRMIALSLAMCTAAVCFASCGKTGKTDKTTTSSAPAEETQPTTVRPTERVRDIEEAGDFEYSGKRPQRECGADAQRPRYVLASLQVPGMVSVRKSYR